AALAALTCLTRAAVGDIALAGGTDLAAMLLEECRAIAAAAGYPPSAGSLKAALGRLTDPRSAVTASMLGDIERRGRAGVEARPGRLAAAPRRCAGGGLLPAPGGLCSGQGGGSAGGAGVERQHAVGRTGYCPDGRDGLSTRPLFRGLAFSHLGQGDPEIAGVP